MRLLILATLLVLLSSACASAPPPRPERADYPPITDSTPRPVTRLLQLAPGITVYEFRQASDIRPESSTDTTYSSIVTEALFTVAISSLTDSTHELTVSADSVRISTSGSAPSRSRGDAPPVSLGTIVRVSLGPSVRNTQALLPDSLCAYGQLVSVAQELALLPLPYGALLGENTWTDSTRFATCRAGVTVESRGLREITYSASQPTELSLRTVVSVQGSGTTRTDSITVNGTVTSSGRAHLEGTNRLPTILRTESHGTITVRLGDSATIFRQQSSQEWRRRLPN